MTIRLPTEASTAVSNTNSNITNIDTINSNTTTTTTNTDFAALILQNKNYKRADVARIDPRDAYRRKQRSSDDVNVKNRNEGGGTVSTIINTHNTNTNIKNNVNVGHMNTIGASLEKIVFRFDEDHGVSILSADRMNRKDTVNVNNNLNTSDLDGVDMNAINNNTMDVNSTTESENSEYFVFGDDDEEHYHHSQGYINTEDELYIEKDLAKSTIESYRNYIQNLAKTYKDENRLNVEKHHHHPKIKTDKSDIFLSKPTLLLQDQIDIEATAQDALDTQEASKLAYQLSLRTKAYLDRNKKVEKPIGGLESIKSSNVGSRIVVGTLSLDERIRLEERRKVEESKLPHHLHGIELSGWESKINWEGITSSSGNDDNVKEEKGTEDVLYPNPKEILSQPFNTAFEGMNLSNLISWDGADAKPGFNERLGKYLGQLTLQDTVAGTSVVQTSGALPIWNPRPFNQSDEYTNRMESKAAGISSGPVSRIQSDMAKRDKEIEDRQKKRAQREIDKTKRIQGVLASVGALDGGTGRAITSSLMGPGGTERTGRPMRHHGSSLAHDFEYIEQLDMINNHSLVKADLSFIELRHYGRALLPKYMFKADEILPWQLQIVVSPQKKLLNGKTGGSYQSSIMPGSISQSKIRNVSDLCPSEGSLVLIEYSEEKLPLKLMRGMASKIVNYYKGEKSKCPISAGGGDRPTKKKKHGLKNQDSDIKGSSGKVEKPPRLEVPLSTSLNVKELIGKIGHKKHGDNSQNVNSSVTILPEGVTEILKDHGPFLGKLSEGRTQTGLINNLFVAPMQRHVPKSTDFLMILGKSKYETKGSKLGVVLRHMPDNMFIAGQTEPKRKVYAPDSKGDKDFVGPFTTYQIAKALQSKQAKERRGLRFEEIKDGLFPYSDVHVNPLRLRIKKVATYDKNTQIWTLKPVGDDFEGIENLSRGFSPEGIAAHWSARCAEQYLRELGLHEISSMSSSVANITIVMSYLNGILEAARKRKKTMESYAKEMRKSKHYDLFAKAKEKLTNSFKEIEYKTKIARFIYEEIQLTPWNLTTDFMDVHRNPQGTGQMKLTGFGDPSGQASGFDFRRVTDKQNKTALVKKGKKEDITGTEKDLRKLSMKEMARILFEEYNVEQKLIKSLRRWDRVHMIRELSTKAASDNAGDGMERYARGEKIKLRDKIEAYKKRIQEIWVRQQLFLQETEDQSVLEKSEAMQKDGDDGMDDEDEDDWEGEDDDDDDDDYVAILQNKMQDTKKKNELVRNGMDNGILDSTSKGRPSQDTAEDAGDLAAFLREKEENLAMTQTNDVKDFRNDEMTSGKQYRNLYKDKKVIRRKITKTNADGSQTTTFKFIINDDEALAKASKKGPMKKLGIFDLNKKSNNATTPIGHSLFEEDESSMRLVHKRKTNRGRGGRRSDADYNPPRSRGTGSKLKGKQEKKKQKRKREDDDDIYLRPTLRRGTNNRKGRGSARELKPHAKMAEALEDIRSTVEKRPNSGPFHRPVDRIACPTYYEIIINPIDLQSIRDKIKRYDYRTADAFIKDFEVMKNNATKFNGFGSSIGTEATKIYEFVKSTIEANRDELTSIELAVEEQFNSGNKKRSRSNTPMSVETSGNPASVTVDGIEQRVYLGNLQGPFGDLL